MGIKAGRVIGECIVVNGVCDVGNEVKIVESVEVKNNNMCCVEG